MALARTPRLLVLRALGLGDLCTGIPALRGLRRAFPEHRLEVAMPARLAGFAHAFGRIPGGGPLIDVVHDHHGVDPLPAELAGPELAVNLHGRGPQSHAILRALGPRQLFGFRDAASATIGPAWDPQEHEVRRWVRMLDAFDIAADPADLHLHPPAHPAPPHVHGATLLHPGAASAARRWPEERWAQVARYERARGRTVVLTGSGAELPACRRIAAAAGMDPNTVLAGRIRPTEFIAVIAACARMVCGDTGPAHLATALGTPSVLLFGPTDPARWGPCVAGPHIVLWAGLTGDPHATVPHAGLLRITVDEVCHALGRLPDHGRPRVARARPGSSRAGAPAALSVSQESAHPSRRAV